MKRLDIRNGLSTSKAMEFDSDWIALIGGGTVNLKNEQIKYGVNPDIKIGGRSNKAPVKITGTLANPDYTVDALALAGQVGGKLLKGAAGGVLGLVGAGGSGGSGPVSNAGCVKVAKTETKPAATKSPVDSVKEAIKDPKKVLEKPKEILKKPGDALKGLFGR